MNKFGTIARHPAFQGLLIAIFAFLYCLPFFCSEETCKPRNVFFYFYIVTLFLILSVVFISSAHKQLFTQEKEKVDSDSQEE